jgi:hypothetical protein
MHLIDLSHGGGMQYVDIHAEKGMLIFGIGPRAFEANGQVLQVRCHLCAREDRYRGAGFVLRWRLARVQERH